MDFNQEQLERYSRHIILAEIGPEGQQKINQGKVLIIGAGGLGSPAALYLAAAGVGEIGIVDFDKVDLSNLQRQIIHATPDLGRKKTKSAEEKIKAINPEVKTVLYNLKLSADNILGIIEDYDFIIDGTDNFAAKFLINDACFFAKKSFSHGGILRFEGQTLTYLPGKTCYRCIFKGMPPAGMVPSCAQAGVLGAIAGMLGTIQAAEAVKFLIQKGRLLTDRMLTFNALEMNFRTIDIKKNPECSLCGSNPTIRELVDEQQPACDLKKGKDDEN